MTSRDFLILVSAVMPCLNEEQTVATCVAKIWKAFKDAAVSGEVMVADNGSTDRSVELAEAAGRAGSTSAHQRVWKCLFDGIL